MGVVLTALLACTRDAAPVIVVRVEHADSPSAEDAGGITDADPAQPPDAPGTDDGTPASSPTTTTSTLPPTPLPVITFDAAVFASGFAEMQGLTGGHGLESFVVTSTDDSGPGTYRDALSRGGRHITFAPELDGATIDLREAVVAPGDDLTLDGSGVDVTITGSATKFTGTNVIVAGLTFRNVDRTGDEDAITFLDASETQVVGVYNNVFDHATDGLVDFIWNRGNDVYATVCGNRFEHHDKAMLIHSGRNGREGGRYHVTLCHNHWVDIYQRMPFSRDADVHQFNSVIERYGKPNGDGGGSKAGDSRSESGHLLEDNVAIPRAVGESTFDGSAVTNPRPEWAGPQLGDSGYLRISGTRLETVGDVTAEENQRQPDRVFTAPYEYRSVPAGPAMRDVVIATAGRCEPAGDDRAVPCAPLLLLQPSTRVEAVVDGEVASVELRFDGETVASGRRGDGDMWRLDVPGEAGTVASMTIVAVTPDGRTASSDPVLVGIID